MRASTTNNRLRTIVAGIERLEDERDILGCQIRDAYAQAKGDGFDLRALRTVIRLRKEDANKCRAQQAILEAYMQALGML